MIYKIYYSGYYIVEADNMEEAMRTRRDDSEVEYEEWENEKAEVFE